MLLADSSRFAIQAITSHRMRSFLTLLGIAVGIAAVSYTHLDVYKRQDVEISLDNAEDTKQLLVGYSADVEVVLDSHDNVLRVPTSTLMEGNKVLIYQPATKKLEARAIKAGITNWEYTEILDGLKQGDRIVASLEREGVKAGVVVKPETEAAPDKIKAK